MGETADAIDDSLRRDKSGPYRSHAMTFDKALQPYYRFRIYFSKRFISA
jgi:hypothetical protein